MKRICAITVLLLWGMCVSAVQKSAVIVYIGGSKYYIHTVQPGETLYSLAKEYRVGGPVIAENNPSIAEGLKAGAKIKIPFVAETTAARSERKLRKTFDMHFVAKGETLYGISRQYAIAIPTLMEDNPTLDPAHLHPGERILIRRKRIGTESEAEAEARWEEYRNSLNSVAEAGYAYHIVRPGETFYSLSRRFGVSEQELSTLNGGLKAADLKAGAMLKVPGTPEPAPLPGTADSLSGEDSLRGADSVREVTFRALRVGEPLHVALLLPLSVDGHVNGNYLEFYQGFLLGLDSMKTRHGHSAEVELFNTGHDLQTVREIVRTPEFRRANLIVGPVYEDVLQPVLEFAEEHAVPVVSPLAQLTRTNSDALFQLSPEPERKYEKLGELVNGDRKVTLIYTESTDKVFEQEILSLLGDSEYTRHVYEYQHPSVRKAEGGPSDLTPLLQGDGEKLFAIMADNEIDVDRILAALASAYTGLTSRGFTEPRFAVLGNARWNRYNNIDRTMFFKNRVIFTSTYHAKRDGESVRRFDSAYIQAFGSLPTLYSYRGYDTAMIFCPGMFSDIEYDMEGRRYRPLQTSYLFGQREGCCNHVNQNWTRVNYNGDFTITLE